MKTLRAVRILPMLLIAVASCPQPFAAQSLPDSIDRVRPAVVRIVISCAYASEHAARTIPFSSGTGFLVSEEGFALTAAHVVEEPCPSVNPFATGPEDRLPLQSRGVLIGFAVIGETDQTHARCNFTSVGAEVVDVDKIHDVALVRLLRNPFKTAIKSGYTLNGKDIQLQPPGIVAFSTRKLREGESIAISGYPLPFQKDHWDHPVFDTTAGIIASVHSSEDHDLPTYFNSAMDRLAVRVGFDLYEADIHANPGNSGGPVYDASSGQVVGVCVAFRPAPVKEHIDDQWWDSKYASNSGLSVVIPICVRHCAHVNTWSREPSRFVSTTFQMIPRAQFRAQVVTATQNTSNGVGRRAPHARTATVTASCLPTRLATERRRQVHLGQ